MPASTNIASILDERAKNIRVLMTDTVKNALAIGAELQIAKNSPQFPIGPDGRRMGWKKWLDEEIGISTRVSEYLIQLYNKFGRLRTALLPSARILRLLLPSNVPNLARKEIIKRAAKGEKVGRAKAKEIIKKHRPSPKKAIAIAKETGKAVVASDGYLYMGASEEELKKADLRRTVVYAVRDAIETLAQIELTAVQFLEFAHSHQLWDRGKNDHEIEDALKWLSDLERAWRMHK